ncbi:SGNH/GDSL hydrolase family protein [Variovorax sp. PBL-E5]|uniref:SGNH/GDSL hydrolase family protein n=1 Tax=Variovorax sp. PBL-E5 TaxID=434014 RepID=UPI0013198E90|nr:SGNH/GDSL hydrolase family protein [Variovorax sp. PBL-E5]VTU37137.1 hypothetical protein E5CHR_04495 [Variovorax sp. PBL-E5]
MLDLILSSRLFGWFFGDMHGRDERGDAGIGRRFISASALATLTACGGGGGGSGAPMLPTPVAGTPASSAPPPAPRDCSIELYGDSILHGMAVGLNRLQEPPAAALQRLRPAYTVIDHSVPGATATAIAAAFGNQQRTGRLIVLEPGVNDINAGLPVDAPYRNMIAITKGEGRIAIVTGLSRLENPPAAWAGYAETIRAIAAEQSVAYANWPEVEGSTVDGTHPDQAFSTALVEQLALTLDRAAPDCAQ